MGMITDCINWIDRKVSVLERFPLNFSHRKDINTFDCDGVIFINERVGGLYPGPDDVIITGRSFEEVPETSEMLLSRGILNKVYYNRCKFDDKTRKTSGMHKAETIKRLQKRGYTIMCHFEDDEIQSEIIRQQCPTVTVVMVVHDLTNKENVRHKKESR